MNSATKDKEIKHVEQAIIFEKRLLSKEAELFKDTLGIDESMDEMFEVAEKEGVDGVIR
jgi:hypothetical protein